MPPTSLCPAWEWLSAAPPYWAQVEVHLGWLASHLACRAKVLRCPRPPLLGGRWLQLQLRLQVEEAAAALLQVLPSRDYAYEHWKDRKVWKQKKKKKKKTHFKFWHFLCHLALPDRSFGHLPILHPTCGGCERGSRGDRWWQRRCGGGGSRHGDDRSCGGRAERPDSDLLRLGGIFATMGTEEHASAICSAAPTAQHRHTPPVETVSYALVRAALKKCALKEEHKAEE